MSRYHYAPLEPQDKDFTALCPTCGREVSNAAYFAGSKGSSHFKGTCTVPTWENVKERELVRQTLQPWNPYRDVFKRPTYANQPTNLAEFYEWWGFNRAVKASKPKGKAAKALAQMGLAA